MSESSDAAELADLETILSQLRVDVEVSSQKCVAESLGISPQYLSDILKGRREPGKSVLAAMGYDRIVFYRKVVK